MIKLVAVGVVPFLHNWAARNKTNDGGHATQTSSVSASCRRATLPAPASTTLTYSLLPVVKLGRPLVLQWHKWQWRSLRPHVAWINGILATWSSEWCNSILYHVENFSEAASLLDNDASIERKWLDSLFNMRRQPEIALNSQDRSSVKLSAQGATYTWVLNIS